MIGQTLSRAFSRGESRAHVLGTNGDDVVLGLDGSGISRRERALSIPIVYSSLSRLSSATRSMPMELKLKYGGQLFPTPPNLRLERLLCDQPNPEQSAEEFYELLTLWMLFRGNGYGFKERDDQGRVVAIWPVPPHRVEVVRNPATRLKEFIVYASSEDPEPIWSGTHRDIQHFRGWGLNPLKGMSAVGAMNALVERSIRQQKHEDRNLANMERPSGVLRVPAGVKAEAIERLKVGWSKRARGGTPVLTDGVEWEGVSLSAADAQFIETKNFTRQDWALIFHLPAMMAMTDTGGSLQYSSADMAGRDFVTFAMLQWKSRLEAPLRIDADLPWGYTGGQRGRLVPVMSTSAFTTVDEFTRAKADALDIKSGARTLAEVRTKNGYPAHSPESPGPTNTENEGAVDDSGTVAA